MSSEANRRDFAKLSAAVGLGLVVGQPTPAGASAAPDDEGDGPLTPLGRRAHSDALRRKVADFYNDIAPEPQDPNLDEDRYQSENYHASYIKGLEHDTFGEVIPASYHSPLTALESGRPADFDRIKLGCEPAGALLARGAREAFEVRRISPENVSAGGQVRLTNPRAGLAFDLEGIDPHQLAIPAAYAFRSKGEIGETAENYWMAPLRTRPFSKYATDPRIARAADDLSKYGERLMDDT